MGSGPHGALPFFSVGTRVAELLSIRCVWVQWGGRAVTTVVTIVGVLTTSATYAISQPNTELSRISQTFETVEAAKQRFAETIVSILDDLGGTYGDEGYRLWAALGELEGSLTAWDEGPPSNSSSWLPPSIPAVPGYCWRRFIWTDIVWPMRAVKLNGPSRSTPRVRTPTCCWGAFISRRHSPSSRSMRMEKQLAPNPIAL